MFARSSQYYFMENPFLNSFKLIEEKKIIVNEKTR